MAKKLIAGALLADLALEVFLYRHNHLLYDLFFDMSRLEERRSPLGLAYRRSRPRRGIVA